MHPVFTIDNCLEAKDVVVSNCSIKVGDKEMPAKCGFVAEKESVISSATVSTLLAFYTETDDTGVKSAFLGKEKVVSQIKIPDVDLTGVRLNFKTSDMGARESVEKIFEAMEEKPLDAQIIVDKVCEQLPSCFVKESKNKEVVNKYVAHLLKTEKKKVNYGGRTYQSAALVPKIGDQPSLDSLYVASQKGAQVRGGDQKHRAILSSGLWSSDYSLDC